MYRDSLWF
jgi:hypothetical protein